MRLFLFSLEILFISIPLMLAVSRFKKVSGGLFLFSLTVGSLLSFMGALNVLVNPAGAGGVYRWEARIPFGELSVGIDPLSAFFLMTITVLFFGAGMYGHGYWKDREEKNLGGHYIFYHLALIFMMVLVTARNAVLFLIAWEAVTLSSYFLITFYDDQKTVRRAGYLFLIAAHTGTFCLWVMFLLMQQHTGVTDFAQMALVPFPLPLAGFLFVLGVVGFGVKTGFIPLHIWLPHAHPAAPSHISAVLSGVMIKMGIYGLMRIIFIVKDFPEWCAVVLLGIGMVSGVGGVLYALGQHEIKKLLAYHSIENIGIIILGIGIGLWGQIAHREFIALVGYAGALLHVFNHAVFKGLLFLSAGSLIRSTHTGEIDRLGGFLKKLPWTGHLFLVGSVAICGLPLLNGFISEWLVFRALFEGVLRLGVSALLVSGLAILSLALIGGLAAACFAKAFGAIFLGTGRSEEGAHSREGPWLMRAPMVMLGGVCLWIGLFPATMVSFTLGAASAVSSFVISVATEEAVISPLRTAVWIFLVLMVMMVVLTLAKRIAVRSLSVERSPTWGCGYSVPTPRMQYSASSFAEPILRNFRNVLGYTVKGRRPQGYFPQQGEISSHVVEASEDLLFRPIFQWLRSLTTRLKIIQYGHTQLYLLYIFIFLLILLVWKMV